MADATGAIAQQDTTGNLIKMLGLVKGTSTETSTQSNVSKLGMDQIIQQILSAGGSGLASIASGGRSAGLYGSTTQQQLMNDFVTRSAGELAKQQAGSTSVVKKPPMLGAKDLISGAAGVGVNKLFAPSIATASKKLGLDKFGNQISEAIFGSGSSAGVAGSGSAAASVAAGTSDIGIGGAFAGSTLGAEAFGGDAIASLLAGTSDIGIGAAAAGAGEAAAAAGIGEAAGAAGIGEALATFATWVASLFSDERLKTDITKVGATAEGQPIYTYKYKDNPITTHMGVMAQETLKYHPEAVSRHPNGALMVNYAKLLGE